MTSTSFSGFLLAGAFVCVAFAIGIMSSWMIGLINLQQMFSFLLMLPIAIVIAGISYLK